ncbi:MAG TPA: hypothetical protein VGJ44_08765, partial [Kribbellaceae bacterium]
TARRRHAACGVPTLTPPAVPVRVDVAAAAPELVAALEAERIPRGTAFTWHPEAPEIADTPDAIAARRRVLAEESDPAVRGWDRRTARLRVVA